MSFSVSGGGGVILAAAGGLTLGGGCGTCMAILETGTGGPVASDRQILQIEKFAEGFETMTETVGLSKRSIWLEFMMRFTVWLLSGIVCGLCTLGGLLHAAEVVTIAGTGQRGQSPDGAVAAKSPVGEPYGLVIGPDGALYVCEIANHLIRRIDLQDGTMTVVAGSGKKGASGAGGPAREADLDEPYEVRFDSSGNMVFVDMKNALVQRVDAKTQTLETLAGTGKTGFSGDGGPATEAQLNRPHSIALDGDDNIYICDIGNSRIRRVDAKTGIIETIVGGGKSQLGSQTTPIANLALRGPRALDVMGDGLFALALREGNAIYRLDMNEGTLTHLAGTGQNGYSGDGGPGLQAKLSGPKGVAVTPAGDIVFADTESHTVRVVRKDSGIVETLVGDGKRGDGPDGDPRSCRLARPHGVCVDADGNVYIGDSENHRVRMLKID